MTTTATKPTYTQIVMLLDACIPALEAAAKREAARPSRFGLRQITEQERLKTVRKVVQTASDSDPEVASLLAGGW